MYPPNHPDCKAIISALTNDEMKSKGLTLEKEFKTDHPLPEWAFNCGKTDWKKFFHKFVKDTLRIRRNKEDKMTHLGQYFRQLSQRKRFCSNLI